MKIWKLSLKVSCVIFNEHIRKSMELDQKGVIYLQHSVILKALLHVLFNSLNDSWIKAYKHFIEFGKQV